ncbi:MAG: ABC transporter substrate-binding protein, partial [Candidatus Hodarchaeales archaeon]
TIYPSKESAEIALENGDIDAIDSQFQIAPDLPYLETKPNIQILSHEGNSVQVIAFNTRYPKLSDHYVRLAISHLVPAQKIVDYLLQGWGVVNEVVGLHPQNPFMPSNEEWKTLGLNATENVRDPQTGELLEFQGHISYNLRKAWGLMEKAGYDMDPWREAVLTSERTEDNSSERLFMDIDARWIAILYLATLGAVIAGIGLVKFLRMRQHFLRKVDSTQNQRLNQGQE